MMIEGLEFSADYTSWHDPDWRQWLAEFVGKPCAGLEVGVFEGRSSAWFMEEICTHPSSRLVAIDPWHQKSQANREILAATYGGRFQFHAERAEDCLSRWHGGGFRFDWIYLDGGKEAARVLEQSVLAWRMLRPGGILIWDDYAWQWTEGCQCARPVQPPGPAIDAFLGIFAAELELVAKAWQVCVRQIDTPPRA